MAESTIKVVLDTDALSDIVTGLQEIINSFNARISALETSLQRVPWANYNKEHTPAFYDFPDGDSYTGDGILIITAIMELWQTDANEIGIRFIKMNKGLEKVVYRNTLFNISALEWNDAKGCKYRAVSIGPISHELMQEAKAVKPQTKTITEITWKDLQATFIDGSCKAGPSFTINTYLHIGFKYSGYLNNGDLVKYQIGVKNADGTGAVLDFVFRVTYAPIISSGQTEYEYSAVSLFAVTDEVKELFGKIC